MDHDGNQTSPAEILDTRDFHAGLRPRRFAVLIACLAFLLGASSTYALVHQRQLRHSGIEAALYERQVVDNGSNIPIVIRIQNLSSSSLTIGRLQPYIPGFKVVSSGQLSTAALQPGTSEAVSYTIAAQCSPTNLRKAATIRLRVRESRASWRSTLITIAQPPPGAAGGDLSTLHYEACARVGAVSLKTLGASTSRDALTLAVRLTAVAPTGGGSPKPERLLGLSTDEGGGRIHATFTGSPHQPGGEEYLPIKGTLSMHAGNGRCTALAWPVPLTASLATQSESGDVPVLYDAQAAAQVLSFTTEHCR